MCYETLCAGVVVGRSYVLLEDGPTCFWRVTRRRRHVYQRDMFHSMSYRVSGESVIVCQQKALETLLYSLRDRSALGPLVRFGGPKGWYRGTCLHLAEVVVRPWVFVNGGSVSQVVYHPLRRVEPLMHSAGPRPYRVSRCALRCVPEGGTFTAERFLSWLMEHNNELYAQMWVISTQYIHVTLVH